MLDKDKAEVVGTRVNPISIGGGSRSWGGLTLHSLGRKGEFIPPLLRRESLEFLPLDCPPGQGAQEAKDQQSKSLGLFQNSPNPSFRLVPAATWVKGLLIVWEHQLSSPEVTESCWKWHWAAQAWGDKNCLITAPGLGLALPWAPLGTQNISRSKGIVCV